MQRAAVAVALVLGTAPAFAFPAIGVQRGAAGTGTLNVEAGLVMQAGNVVRIARTRFQLLSKSATALLMENDPEGLSHFKVPPHPPDGDMELNTYCSLRDSPKFRDIMKDQQRRIDASMLGGQAIEKVAVQATETDFDGKATFSGLRAGTYWVFGCYSTASDDSFNWDVSVALASGETKRLLLDQNNAAKH